MFVRIVDKDGYFVEDAIVEEVLDYMIETPCPDGFYRPRWDFESEQWVEGLSQEEIDSIKNEPVLPSLEERVTALETLELERMFDHD